MTARSRAAIDQLPPGGRIIIAFSGGPDSVCLLHVLADAVDRDRLHVVHVDHGLDPESPERARRAEQIARETGVACIVVPVQVDPGPGLEAAARKARYQALAGCMDPGDMLATAHHADDQAETVLLRLLRGAGPEGLAGIRAQRPFKRGRLIRPLLDWRREDIRAFLDERGLESIEDPANECLEFDRNEIRHRLLPLIRERWPGAERAILRSARLCRGSADFVVERTAAEMKSALDEHGTLILERLPDANSWYLGEIVRRWCLQLGWEPPPGRRLDEFIGQLGDVQPDRQPELRWDGHRIRCWRGRLWADADDAPPSEWNLEWDGLEPIQLPGGQGRLSLTGEASTPLALRITAAGCGGRIETPAGSRSIRQLMAEADVPPWRRAGWPLVWKNGRIVALPPLWHDAGFADLLRQRGQDLVWRRDDDE
jgi:tRNA(Ile)-lysidine synthase